MEDTRLEGLINYFLSNRHVEAGRIILESYEDLKEAPEAMFIFANMMDCGLGNLHVDERLAFQLTSQAAYQECPYAAAELLRLMAEERTYNYRLAPARSRPKSNDLYEWCTETLKNLEPLVAKGDSLANRQYLSIYHHAPMADGAQITAENILKEMYRQKDPAAPILRAWSYVNSRTRMDHDIANDLLPQLEASFFAGEHEAAHLHTWVSRNFSEDADQDRSLELLSQSAEAGVVGSMHLFADACTNRLKNPEMRRLAIKWFAKAARRGCVDSMFRLGLSLDPNSEYCIIPNEDTAMRWYERAALKRHPEALFYLECPGTG